MSGPCCKALVRPHLEYANSTWNPYRKADIISIENVKKRATKMLPSLKNLTYEERLKSLELPILRFRRLRGDIIEVFKILTGIYDKRVCSDLFGLNLSSTRGHPFKLKKKRSRLDVRKHFFTNRVIDIWNSLPESVVLAKTLYSFENRLDKFWANQPMKYDFEAEYVLRSEGSHAQKVQKQSRIKWCSSASVLNNHK
ncbi:hypothetical protein FSP39_015873 [Pinctada imbricata]|uniref:RNA-directed DNA polymerase from mobile element jockey-like n=1 Tax=Pinctada imbricata TaxID=66713 RepID=A0AA88XMN7_PINIB|nr:hypothetical protein FSP39_015873 [Pinctada imbricata]